MLLPPTWGQALHAFPQAEEIRLRVGHRPRLIIGGKEKVFTEETICEDMLHQLLIKASSGSLHTVEDQLRSAFLVYRGLRIGICGEGISDSSKCKGFRRFSSLAIRIPHETISIDESLLDTLYTSKRWSCLICSPPGGGKTSLLRRMIRDFSARGVRVGVIDERCELAAVTAGEVSFDRGPCSDILSGLSKQTAAALLLRGMNPQIIAMDEITTAEDVALIRDLTGCGVEIFATAHGSSRTDMLRRPVYRSLFEAGSFLNCVRIETKDGTRHYTLERMEI